MKVNKVFGIDAPGGIRVARYRNRAELQAAYPVIDRPDSAFRRRMSLHGIEVGVRYKRDVEQSRDYYRNPVYVGSLVLRAQLPLFSVSNQSLYLPGAKVFDHGMLIASETLRMQETMLDELAELGVVSPEWRELRLPTAQPNKEPRIHTVSDGFVAGL